MKIKCLMCNEVLESKGFDHHDFQQCSCMNQAMIDQILGTNKFRYGARYPDQIEFLDNTTKGVSG